MLSGLTLILKLKGERVAAEDSYGKQNNRRIGQNHYHFLFVVKEKDFTVYMNILTLCMPIGRSSDDSRKG